MTSQQMLLAIHPNTLTNEQSTQLATLSPTKHKPYEMMLLAAMTQRKRTGLATGIARAPTSYHAYFGVPQQHTPKPNEQAFNHTSDSWLLAAILVFALGKFLCILLCPWLSSSWRQPSPSLPSAIKPQVTHFSFQ